MTTPTLLLAPRRAAVIAGLDQQLDVLVRVQAPPQPATQQARTPLNLALVIDRSGSMSGAPLEAAKDCARFIVDRLGPEDHVSLVTYDGEAEVRVPTQRVTNKATLHVAIAGITSGGSTDLHAGWLKGAEQAAKQAGGRAISRVLLLSDGCANHGLTDVDAIAQQCADLAATGVSTSTYGLGQGFNETLMIGMAKAGQGRSYYGESAEDLRAPFEEEFDLLSALHARQVSLTVQPAAGVHADVRNDYPRDAQGCVRLPDLVYGGESWAIVRLRIPATLAGKQAVGEPPSALSLLSLTVDYANSESQPQPPVSTALALPPLSPAVWEALTEDPLVVARSQELDAAAIQDRAERAAREHDWDQVSQCLAEVREHCAGNEWLQGVASKLEDLASQRDAQRFTKETAFASHRMRSRTAASREPMTLYQEALAPSFLRRKQEQGRGSSRSQ